MIVPPRFFSRHGRREETAAPTAVLASLLLIAA